MITSNRDGEVPIRRRVHGKARVVPVREIYRALFDAWGPQHWWPGRARLEIMVGAILTQNTAWSNVERAIRRLRQFRALRLSGLHEAPMDRLADWIRPAGFFRVKAKRLRAFTSAIEQRFGGDLRRLFRVETLPLRAWLLGIHGIGPETADSILLYAAGRPVFVVDAYTRRFMIRHGWIGAKASYDDVAKVFTGALPREAALYNEYHALIVALGKQYCRARPRCEGCPLRRWPTTA